MKICVPYSERSDTKAEQRSISFMSHLFTQMGYKGWAILVDETELMGRLGRKALSTSYVEDVIEGKHEYENLEEVYPEEPEPAKTVLDLLTRAPQLLPLTREEINEVLCKIQDFHGRAYGGHPACQLNRWRRPRSRAGICCARRSARP